MTQTAQETIRQAAQKADLPGDIPTQELLKRMIRVDHAGEFGAKRIYAGQIAVLKGTKEEPILRHMLAQEEVHFDTFDKLMARERIRPTILQPIWNVAGYALGAATALMGKEAAMACTVAVEEAIDEHYQEQYEALGDKHPELKETIEKFRQEELEHRDIGLENDAEKTPFYHVLYHAIHKGSKAAIYLSERF